MTQNNPKQDRDPIQEWTEEYRALLDSPPCDDEVLYTHPDEFGNKRPARLFVKVETGKPPFIYATAYVPDVVGCELGWRIRGIDENVIHGWKVILCARSRQEVIRRYGLSMRIIPVTSIKITGESESKQSLLGEVHEFLSDDDFKLISMELGQ
jgi:hypothetical protein